jgi:hypothetical protein
VLLVLWSHGHPIYRASGAYELAIGPPHHHALGPRAHYPHACHHARLGGALPMDLAWRHVSSRGHVPGRGHGGGGDVARGTRGHCLGWGHVRHWRHRVSVH